MREQQSGANTNEAPGGQGSTDRSTTRRKFIKSGVAVAGGIILGGEYVKPTLRSVSINTSIAQAYGPPPPPPPPPSFSPRTIGYWKNHPEAWTVNSLLIGAITYTKQQLLAMLKAASAKNISNMLAAQLIAAKLNMLSGAFASSTIQSTIIASDAFLVTYPPGKGQGPTGSARTTGEGLKNTLDTFNNSGGDRNTSSLELEP